MAAWPSFQGPAKNLSKGPVFAILDNKGERNRIAETEDPFGAWPVEGDFPRPSRQSKETSQNNRQNRAAWAILKALALWKEWNLLSEDDRKERNSSAMRDFAANFDVEMPSKVPVTSPAPLFGPLIDHGETELETYNRAWEMMKYLSSLMPKDRDEKGKSLYHQRVVYGLEGGKLVQSSTRIHWMDTQAKEAAMAMSSSREASPPNHDSATAEEEADILLPSVDIHVVWNEYRQFDGSDALACVLEDAKTRGFATPPEDQLLERDPVGFESGESFRDYLRHLLNCGNIRMCVKGFKLTYVSGDTKMKKGIDIRRARWRDTQQVFRDSDENSDFVITLEVEAIDEEDDEAPLFESDYIFPAVRQMAQERIQYPPAPNEEDQALLDPAETTEAIESSFDESLEYAQFIGVSSSCNAPSRNFQSEETKLAYYSGFDVDTDDGRRQWRKETINAITENCTLTRVAPNRLTVASKEELNGLDSANMLTHDEAQDLLEKTDDADYYTIHQASSGSQERVGPYLDLSLELLMCTEVTGAPGQYLSSLVSPAQTTCQFFHYQIVAAVGILLKLNGHIHGRALLKACGVEATSNRAKKAIKAAEKLTDLQTYGSIVADSTGFGKTKETLLALLIQCLISKVNKPSMILVPAPLVAQWLKEAKEYWPGLRVILSHGDPTLQKEVGTFRLTSKQMRNKSPPQYLRYIFDQENPDARMVVILSSYETHRERTAELERTELCPAVSYDPPRYDDSGSEILKDFIEYWVSPNHTSAFNVLVLDEAHRVKNTQTAIWTILSQQRFESNILITATPMFNSIDDLAGLVGLLGARGVDRLKSQFDSDAELAKQSGILEKTPLSKLKEYFQDIPATSPLRLNLLKPSMLRKIAKEEGFSIYTAVAVYFALVLNTVALQRSQASSLRNSNGSLVPLKSSFKKIKFRTAEARLLPTEQQEYETWHYVSAIDYANEAGSPQQARKDEKKPKEVRLSNTTTIQEVNRRRFGAGARHFRRLEIATCSTKLARFDAFCEKGSLSTKTEQIDNWRKAGARPEYFYRICKDETHLALKKAEQLLKFMASGSPRLRVIFQELLTWKILEPLNPGKWCHHQKLLVVECLPATAWFIELALRALLVGVRTLHAGLSTSDRDTLIHKFNDPESDLKVLIMTYDVGSVGLNLHQACGRVILSAPGKSWNHEAQAAGRCLRITSKFNLTVIRIYTPDSFDTFRFDRQAEKASLQLAVNARQPAIQSLLVKLLQQFQVYVDDFVTSAQGQAMLTEGQSEAKRNNAELAHFIQEACQGHQKASQGKKKKKQPSAGLDELGPSTALNRSDRNRTQPTQLIDDTTRPGADSMELEDERCDPTYVDDSDSENAEMEDLHEMIGTNQDIFQSIIARSTRKFNRMKEIERMLSSRQPSDNLRRLSTLLLLPPNKTWTDEDLNDDAHPEYFRFALRLLFDQQRGIAMDQLRIGAGIFLPYNHLSELVRQNISSLREEVEPGSEEHERHLRRLQPRKGDTARSLL
ncbi:Helicase, C-terminal [Penicillium expansum]|nr:Helicase, C-terminal [Penicillium expansum]